MDHFEPVRVALEKHLPGIDVEAVEAILAVMLANLLDGDPVWLMLVGPPSTGKTVILSPLDGIWGAVILSALTPNTLLSGWKGTKSASLLNRLGKRPIIVIKELGTLLSNKNTRAEVFAQLREVYDGYYAKSFGTGKSEKWEGHATLLVGFTSAIDLYSLDSLLGERFVRVRLGAPVDPVEQALRGASVENDVAEARKALKRSYRLALNGAKADLSRVSLSACTQEKLARVAAFIAMARTEVPRSAYGGQVQIPPETEGTPRIMQSLMKLAVGVAALRGETDLEDLSLAHRVALETVPEPRRSIIRKALEICLVDGRELTVAAVRGFTGETTTRNVVDDLTRIGVLRDNGSASTSGDAGRPATQYVISDTVTTWLEESGLLAWIEANPLEDISPGHSPPEEEEEVKGDANPPGLSRGNSDGDAGS